jgi:putative DNA-invertase from lambdoid prophage Rac
VPPPPRVPVVYQYVRVSNPEQVDGTSLESQGQALAALAAKDFPASPAVLLEEPGVSASKVDFCNRPQAARLLALVKRGDVVMFTRMDRAFRNVPDMWASLKMFSDLGVRVICPDFPGTGLVDTATISGQSLVFSLGISAQVESQRKSERKLESNRMMIAQGRLLCHIPHYGFKAVSLRVHINGKTRPVKFLFPNPAERQLMHSAAVLHAKGHGQQAISDSMYRNNLRVRGKWLGRDGVNMFLKAERRVRAAEQKAAAQGVDFHRYFVTPYGAVVPFDRFHDAVGSAVIVKARNWRVGLEPIPGEAVTEEEGNATVSPDDVRVVGVEDGADDPVAEPGVDATAPQPG